MPLNGVVCKKLNCESITCEDFRNVVVSVSRGPCYHFGPALSEGSDLWVRTVSSGHLVPSSTFHCSPLQGGSHSIYTLMPISFLLCALLCRLLWSRTHLGATWDICSGARDLPERSKATIWAQNPPTILLFWVRAAELSPALCKATDEPSSVPLWTHTPSYLFPKRGSGVARWGLFVKPGMFCANEILSHGWLTGWKRARRGPGDSSWMRVMWNQVGCFWGHGTLARRIWMGNSLYCMSSLPSPQRRKEISLRGTAMLATSEFVLRRDCWFVLQGEREKLLCSQSSAHYSQWWQLCYYAGPAYHCAVKVGL